MLKTSSVIDPKVSWILFRSMQVFIVVFENFELNYQLFQSELETSFLFKRLIPIQVEKVKILEREPKFYIESSLLRFSASAR